MLETSGAESDSTVGGLRTFRSVSVASTVADEQVAGLSHRDDSKLQSTPVTVIKKSSGTPSKVTPTQQSAEDTNSSIQNLMTNFSNQAHRMHQHEQLPPCDMPPPQGQMDKGFFLFIYLEYQAKEIHPSL